jgi:hypothetical protein
MRKMATDSDGDSYVAERSVGDATVRVLPGTIVKERRGSTAIWTAASYEVCGPGGEVAGTITRNSNGSYDVPGKASRVGLTDAVQIALGRQEPPAPTRSRATVPGENLEAVLAASLASARPGPQVIAEDRANWTLKQGDRIMRHLALYGAEGVDAQTMSAGMHDMPTTKIRAHLRRLMKNDGPVVETEKGYARRAQG